MKIINFSALFAIFILAPVSCVSKVAKNSAPTSIGQSARQPSESSPILVIKVNGQTRQFSRENLLSSPTLKKITVEKDPAYGFKRTAYSAVPVSELFSGLKVDATGTLLFTCLDGFSAPISIARILNTNPEGSIAYIAIEQPSESWPAVKPEDPLKSAGPFYLIWDHHEKSKIVTEEWPYQIASFEWKASVETQFPHTVPDSRLGEDNPIRSGYKIFMQNCFACHTLNGEGQSQLGPDLNIPNNPTEYLKPGYLTKLIRNPQNLRHWPQAKMPGFDPAMLPEKDLHSVILYLQHMSTRKVQY